jgi:hypothetical protein
MQSVTPEIHPHSAERKAAGVPADSGAAFQHRYVEPAPAELKPGP